jgi:hypothetical protein
MLQFLFFKFDNFLENYAIFPEFAFNAFFNHRFMIVILTVTDILANLLCTYILSL